MWLALPLLLLIVLVLAGGLVVGGIYAIVLVPIAAIVLIGAVVYTMWDRASEPPNLRRERQGVAPLPHTPGQNAQSSPSTPNEIVDAQRQSQ
jgi:hypothetical protein